MNRSLTHLGVVVSVILLQTPARAGDGLPQEQPPEEEPERPTYSSLIDDGNKKVEARFIGLTGGIMLGAEVVMVTEGLLHVNKVWPYVTMPILGGAAGGVGGYFLEKNSPAGAVALFVTGIVLIIPTAILVKSAMGYHPKEKEKADEEVQNGARYSFELPPEESSRSEDGTTTEVERRPEEPPKTEPTTEPTSQHRIEDRSGDAASGRAYSRTERRSRKRHAQTAAVRRATAGSLIFVDRDGTTGLSVPQVDVSPAVLTPAIGTSPRDNRTGIRIFIPLLRVDLP